MAKRVLAIAVAVLLGLTSAGVGFTFFFNAPDSRLFPGILWPAGALALGAFVASVATRSFIAGGFALAPALGLPVIMSVWLVFARQSVNGWPVVAVGACITAMLGSGLGKLVSRLNPDGDQAGET